MRGLKSERSVAFLGGGILKFKKPENLNSDSVELELIQMKLFHPRVQGPGRGKDFLKFLPKMFSVGMDPGVYQFVQDDIVPEFRRQAVELEIKAEVVVMGATPPAGFLLPDGYPAAGEAVLSGQFPGPGNKGLFGFVLIDGAEQVKLRLVFPVQVVLLPADPVEVSGYQFFGFLQRPVPGKRNPDSPVGLNEKVVMPGPFASFKANPPDAGEETGV